MKTIERINHLSLISKDVKSIDIIKRNYSNFLFPSFHLRGKFILPPTQLDLSFFEIDFDKNLKSRLNIFRVECNESGIRFYKDHFILVDEIKTEELDLIIEIKFKSPYYTTRMLYILK